LFSILVVRDETENLGKKSAIIEEITDSREAHTFVACLDRVCEMASVNLRAQGREETLYPVAE
jgi:hypothetical protein